MANDLKTKLLNDLDESVATIVDTVVAISSQGYLVNNAKFVHLGNLVILEKLFKEYDMFSKDMQKELISLYNML